MITYSTMLWYFLAAYSFINMVIFQAITKYTYKAEGSQSTTLIYRKA